MKHTNIYGLYDPRELVNGEIENIRYVGKADISLDRLSVHIQEAKRGTTKDPKYRWIRKLLRDGVEPEMLILCRPPIDCWKGTEQQVIDVLRTEGHNLLNITEGGDGCILDLEGIERRNASIRQAHKCSKVRKSKSEAQKRRYADPKERSKTSAAVKRVHRADPSIRKRMSVSIKLALADPEVKARRQPAKGECNGFSKLTRMQVWSIRSLYRLGRCSTSRYRRGAFRQTALAAKFGLSVAHISDIINRKVWAHLPLTQHLIGEG